MPLQKTHFLIFLALVLVCLASSSARADDIVITGGSFIFTSHGEGGTLTNNVNFSITVGQSDPATSCAFGCPAGASMTVGRTGQGTDFGFLTYNGVTYDGSHPFTGEYVIGNRFSFSGSSFTMDPNNLTVRMPFTFTGEADVFQRGAGGGDIFTFNLTGSGIATFEMQMNGDLIAITRITYAFQPQAAPTPEPATLGLLGLGLAGVASREVRRRLRKD